MTDNSALDSLVGEWLTVPEVADRLGIDAGKVRRLVHEGRLAVVRRGRSSVVSVPADFLVPEHLENPANSTLNKPEPEPDEYGVPAPRWAVLASLYGTFTLLRDAGFADDEAIEWLFTPDTTLGETPISAMRTGRKTAVRRIAMTLL
ncbi:Rv2175c family DNA-binding protein [Pengzhenrongella frigida]|uniref:DNA-binding protein n=1 Tax=Pengzhenrongella frigida TaxID=1259133 RepID=A0A4Q5MXE5_9MICO|nr:Rv2175c family DNA-binding protein [Cellulomonas sp. HLT2-17]RYV50328.1 DNA-binding protein [Cellulomonas sp. HLT2-17]